MLFITFNNTNQLILVDEQIPPRSDDEPPRSTILKGYRYPEQEIIDVAFHKPDNRASSFHRKSDLTERPWNILIVVTKSSVDLHTLAKNADGRWVAHLVLNQYRKDNSKIVSSGVKDDILYIFTANGELNMWHLPSAIPKDPDVYWNTDKLRMTDDRSMFCWLQCKFQRTGVTSFCIYRDSSTPLVKLMPVVYVFLGCDGYVEVWKGIDIRKGIFTHAAVLDLLGRGRIATEMQVTVEEASNENKHHDREKDMFFIIVGTQHASVVVFRVQLASLDLKFCPLIKPSSFTACGDSRGPVTTLALKTVQNGLARKGSIIRIYVVFQDGSLVVIHFAAPGNRHVFEAKEDVGDIVYDQEKNMLVGFDKKTGAIFGLDADGNCLEQWLIPGKKHFITKGLIFIDHDAKQLYPTVKASVEAGKSDDISKRKQNPGSDQGSTIDDKAVEWAIQYGAAELRNLMFKERTKVEKEARRHEQLEALSSSLSNIGIDKSAETIQAVDPKDKTRAEESREESDESDSDSSTRTLFRPMLPKITDEERRRFYQGGPLVGNENIPIGVNPCNPDGSLPDGWEKLFN